MALWGITVTGEVSLGELLVAGGTLALAFFTWRLGEEAKQDVGKAEEAIAAQDMPFVIASPQGDRALRFSRHEDREGWGFSLRLWNIGKGPAMVEDVQLRVGGHELLDALDAERPVAADQAHDLESDVIVSLPDDGFEADTDGVLRVFYTHADGSEHMTTSRVGLVGAITVFSPVLITRIPQG